MTMRAMSYSEYGDPQTLELTDLPLPKVAPGAVLIKIERASVNPVDWKLMSGGLDGLIDVVFPVIPGWDVSGVIEATGPDVPEFSAGDRVASYARKDFTHGGTYAEYVSVPATSVARIPDGVDFDSAAGLPLAGLTAQRSLETLEVTAEDTLLIHAASGGVGHLAAQLAVERGATVLGTASEKNHAKLRELGVTPLSYGEGLADRVREAAPQGVTTVADFVGGVLEDTLAVLTEGGRHISVADPTVEEHGGRWIWVRPDGDRLGALLDKVAADTLRVAVDRVFPLQESAAAMEANQSGSNGKILIDTTR
ncbi:NADPH:quinone reductase-like Zn-dependent oxidoreductase [Nesterenkonia sandarakina]|uniref:NADPH:quinone reductase-like Zn-dependent oxidoreductase n=2 Tax=Nesterenkonia sandarakina TaxID=272918 RepID=A0A2T0YE89_9MICC|nr:NADPH:quinone reductase-like Zn-dependent oxidoreductase [Nesterenkonia sandarakina]